MGLFSLHILCLRKSCKYMYPSISSGLFMTLFLMTMALKQCGGYHVTVVSLTATEAAFPTHLLLSAPNAHLGDYKNPPSRSCPVFFQQLYPKPFTSSPVAYKRLCRARLNHCCNKFWGRRKKMCFKGPMGIPHLLQRKLMQSQVLQALNSICAFHS